MNACAWSPAQATGFFQAYANGSTGAGICLEKGVTTTVQAKHEEKQDARTQTTPTNNTQTTITINNTPTTASSASTSFEVVRTFEEITGEKIHANIRHECEVPIGFGLNASAAAALSLSLALNKALDAKQTFEQCVKIANESEVKCKTGLGGAIAEATGGFCVRRKPADVKAVEKIRVEKNLHAVFGFNTPIQTSEKLANKKIMEKINEAGKKKLEEFEREKTIEKFIQLSREFVLETKIASPRVEQLLTLFPECTMTLFGEGVFGITNEPRKLEEKLKSKTKFTLSSRISSEGAKVL